MKAAQIIDNLFESNIQKSAVRDFGITDDIISAGWICRDGTLIDFKRGQADEYDHNAITGYTSTHSPKQLAKLEGMIRLCVNHGILDIPGSPTVPQWREIQRAINAMDEMHIDLEGKGDSETLETTDKDAAEEFIRNYYAGNKYGQSSQFRLRHASW